MAVITLGHERRGEQDLVFAYLPEGLVWALDRVSGRQWWYVADPSDALRRQITDALAGATPASSARDLAARRPGHELLAEIERQHAAATAGAPGGPPGTLPEEIVAWCVGFVGEEAVARTLAALPVPWQVLHSVPVGTRGDIDHVVVGPPGVFVVNTKHHPGGRVDVKANAVYVGRDYRDYLGKSRVEAERAQEVIDRLGLPVRAMPVLCVVGASVRVKEPPVGVQVTTDSQIVPWFLAQPQTLTSGEVVHVHEALRDAGAWTTAPPTASASPWVADLARQLAAEHVIVKQQRAQSRSRRPTTQPVAARGVPVRRLTRSLLRALAPVAALLLLLALLPSLVAGLSAAFQHTAPKPAPHTVPSAQDAVVGKACTTRGARATDAVGHPLVCTRKTASAPLTWRGTP